MLEQAKISASPGSQRSARDVLGIVFRIGIGPYEPLRGPHLRRLVDARAPVNDGRPRAEPQPLDFEAGPGYQGRSPMDPTIRASLDRLGINASNYRVLMLLPLVYVGWSDGHIDEVEIACIDDLAKERFLLDMSGLAILDGWMQEPPSAEYFDEGLQALFQLAQTETGEPLIHPEDLHELLTHAEAIARATAAELDSPTSISDEEEKALEEIARALHLDNGVSWRKLLDELDAGPASVASGRAPRSKRGGKKKAKAASG